MSVKLKIRKPPISAWAGIAIGWGTSLLATVLACGIITWLIHNEHITQNAMTWAAAIAALSSALLGCTVSMGIVKGKKLIICVITAAAYFITLLAITAMVFEGEYSDVETNAGMILAGGAIALLPTIIRGKGGGKFKKIAPFR